MFVCSPPWTGVIGGENVCLQSSMDRCYRRRKRLFTVLHGQVLSADKMFVFSPPWTGVSAEKTFVYSPPWTGVIGGENVCLRSSVNRLVLSAEKTFVCGPP
ncbi:hypothetical protein PoB_005062200 [Plakobranchus ocellatus]|uniref:Uncharacterized protein n=1 Tax=Plakobranchus ocellatus TaxID=259542 RepID=A0AAV4BXQ7_9GAST|nr:hypothetical protein PoB_005062200 [Plakobranchus ocellatus]